VNVVFSVSGDKTWICSVCSGDKTWTRSVRSGDKTQTCSVHTPDYISERSCKRDQNRDS